MKEILLTEKEMVFLVLLYFKGCTDLINNPPRISIYLMKDNKIDVFLGAETATVMDFNNS